VVVVGKWSSKGGRQLWSPSSLVPSLHRYRVGVVEHRVALYEEMIIRAVREMNRKDICGRDRRKGVVDAGKKGKRGSWGVVPVD
jgi:hypothetical protein